MSRSQVHTQSGRRDPTGENLQKGAQREITERSTRVYAASKRLFETIEKTSTAREKIKKKQCNVNLSQFLSHNIEQFRVEGSRYPGYQIHLNSSTGVEDRTMEREVEERLSEKNETDRERRSSASRSYFLIPFTNLCGYDTQSRIQFAVWAKLKKHVSI